MNPDHYDFTLGINLTPEEQDLSVLFSGEARPFPGHKIGPSVHDFYLIHTVLEGGGCFRAVCSLPSAGVETPSLFSPARSSAIRQIRMSLGIMPG